MLAVKVPPVAALGVRSYGPTGAFAAVPPAISGQHGDVHTFRVCCRLVRGFALDDRDALEVLGAWNARCQPPWSDRELADKIRRARKYGHEPVGGMIGPDTLSNASARMSY